MDYEQEIKRNYRWNFGMIAGVDGAWGFGSAMVHHVAILPAFLERLGGSALAIGLFSAVYSLSLFAPQLLAAHATRHLAVKKRVFTLTHYPGTLSLLPLAWLTASCGTTHPTAVMACTFMWIVLFGVSISFAMPMWVNLMAKLFPAPVRGRSFGYVWLLNGIFGAVGALCAARVLQKWTYPLNFAILFASAGVVLAGCVTSFFWLREPPKLSTGERGMPAFLRDVAGILFGGSPFAWFLTARFIGAFAMMGVAFYTVAGLDRFGLASDAAGMFGATLLAAQVAGSLVGGRLGDRFGFKLLLVLTAAFDTGAALLALCAQAVAWYYGVFVLVGLSSSFGMIGGHNLAIESCPSEDKTTFIALTSTILCPAYVLGPFLGGVLAKYHPARYNAAFAIAALCAATALVVAVLRVVEPRTAKASRPVAGDTGMEGRGP